MSSPCGELILSVENAPMKNRRVAAAFALLLVVGVVVVTIATVAGTCPGSSRRSHSSGSSCRPVGSR